MKPLPAPLADLRLDESLMERLLSRALARGADFAEIFAESGEERSLRWEEGKVKSAGLGQSRGLGLRVLLGERTGYAYAEELDEASLLGAADTAAHIAQGARAGEMRSLRAGPPAADHYPNPRPLSALPVAEKVPFLEAAHRAATGTGSGVERVLVTLVDEERHILVANSEGLLSWDSQPLIRMNVQVVASDGSRRESAFEGLGGRRGVEALESGAVESMAARVADLALRKLEASEAPAGAMPVVLGGATSGVLLHEAVGHGLEADFNRKGTSTYSGRVGEKVASPLCSIVDDGTVMGDRGAINVDDEGCPAGRNVLVEKGVLRGYMQDRLSAGIMGVAPTGNGRRQSFRHFPMPRMTCTYMLPGESDPEEILASVDRGFYAKRLGGGQVDIARGDFVFRVEEGYAIEKGRLGPLVRGATLIGNGPEVMGRVDMVGSRLEHSEGMWTCGKRGQQVPVGLGMPHLRISEITVGGTRS